MTGVFGAAARSSFDVALLDTFASASYRELDYVHEGKNQDRMAAAVRHLPQAPRTPASAFVCVVVAASVSPRWE